MRSLILIYSLLLVVALFTTGCELPQEEQRDGAEITDPDKGIGVRNLKLFADFDLDSNARVTQMDGLLMLPDTFHLRDFVPTEDVSYLQIEVIDYMRNQMIASICYKAGRNEQTFYYDHTTLEYGDCIDDVAWTYDLSTLDVRIERSDTIRATGFGDFRGVRKEFNFNVVNEE